MAIKHKITKRKRKNPNTPTSKENMTTYLNASIINTSDLIQQNLQKLENLPNEDLQQLIQLADNFEQWVVFKLGLVRL